MFHEIPNVHIKKKLFIFICRTKHSLTKTEQSIIKIGHVIIRKRFVKTEADGLVCLKEQVNYTKEHITRNLLGKCYKFRLLNC